MKKIYLLLSICIILSSCEPDQNNFEKDNETVEVQTQENISNIRLIDAKEIPEILNSLKSKLGTEGIGNNKISYKKSHIQLDEIMEVKGKAGKINYTLPILLDGQPENEFYNLIVHKTGSGKVKKAYIKRYIVNPEAMSNYLAHDRNFFYFEGSYKNYWIDDFYGAIERENNKVSFKTSSTCDDGGTIGGSGGSYNPDLIDENNSVTWTDSGQTGYTRPSGSWNHYGGTGGYDLHVDVRDVSTGRTETASVNSLTSCSILYNNGTATNMTHQVYGSTDEVRIITEKSGSNPNGPCEIKRITSADGYTTFDVSDCFTVQQLSSQNPTKATGDCPVDDGEVGVIDNSTRTSIIQKLGLLKGSPEYGWLYGELNTEEIQQVNNLDLYLDANTTTEAIFFGLEAIRAFMAGGKVEFENEIINLLVGRALCIYNKLKNTNLFTNTVNGYRNDEKLKLTLKIGTLADCSNQAGAEACTDANIIDENGKVTIYIIDQNVAYLEMAKNLIHEGIHAELYRFVHNYNGFLDINDRKSVIGLYLFYKGVAEQGFMDSGKVASVYQHEYMAENYVIPIATAIRELDNNRYDLSYYMWYGWEGLENTYQFKNRLTEAQKTTYINKKNQVNATTNVNCN